MFNENDMGLTGQTLNALQMEYVHNGDPHASVCSLTMPQFSFMKARGPLQRSRFVAGTEEALLCASEK